MNKSIRYAVCVGKRALTVRLLGRCSRFCETTVFFYRCQQEDNQIEIPGQTEDSLTGKMQAVNLLLGWTHDLELYDFSHSLHRSPNHSHLLRSHLQRQILKYAHCRLGSRKHTVLHNTVTSDILLPFTITIRQSVYRSIWTLFICFASIVCGRPIAVEIDCQVIRK